jgi:hypothetical protein
VKETIGHSDISITDRYCYARLSQEHKKKAVNLLVGLTAPSKKCDQKWSQNGHIFDSRRFDKSLST